MTYKLVGLMSVVLLLSLAAFAMMMNHYQDQVMDEVASTVSEVGRATLQTLDPGRRYEFHSRVGEDELVELTTEVLRVAVPPGSAPTDKEDEQEVQVLAPRGGAFVMIATDGGAFRHATPEGDVELQPRAVAEGEQVRRRVTVVRVDDVRAEEDPDRGLRLRIPTISAGGDETTAIQQWVAAEHAGGEEPAVESEAGPLRRQDFLLEVPTADYQSLFSSVRRRSAIVFLGVFLVGTALSAGLFTRFTRPVRRLDAAIHRLSEGDLDVRVEARGEDEMARLGRAFNQMAHSLRMSRERGKELTRREKLSALGRLAAGVAHDVRNPLHSVNLTLQHLEETGRPQAPDRAAEFDRGLKLIREEIGRLDRLVDNFLNFARSDRRSRVCTDLARLARETVRLVEKEAERRGIEMEVVAPDTVPGVRADIEAVRSSILNLVLNSFEAMPEGGRLALEIVAGQETVELTVRDTGRGIAEQDQERVFDFAYTTREAGHGLGLAMVHQVIVEEHGGQVRLESEPGRGTAITLGLPLDGSDEEDAA